MFRNKSLKIALIAHAKHPIREPFAGGLECHTAVLAQGLRARGHFVTLFSAGGGKASPLQENFCRELAAFAGYPDGGFAYEHSAYHNLMQSIGNRNFDIVHNNSLHYLPVAMADRLAIPMVTTLHTPPFWEMAGSIQLSRHTNNCFVAVSASVAKSWSCLTDVHHVIPNGVDLKTFVFQAIPDNEPYLFWSGRIVPEKGLHLAIDAAGMARMKLLFAGPVSDALYFEQDIRPRFGDQVRYMGHLDHARLTALKGGARACLCTPMWQEPYGLVVAEALACGTPVAGFAQGALPDLIDGKSGALVEAGDAQALGRVACAVQSLSRRDCRDRAEEIGDAEKMILGYEDLYEELRTTPWVRQAGKANWYQGLLSRESLRDHYLRHLPADFSEVA